MKKVVLFFAISAACGFASCDDKAANTNNQDTTVVAVDTVAAQDSSVKSDSVVVADTLASEIDSVKALGEAQAE